MKKILPFITLLLGVVFTVGAYLFFDFNQKSIKPDFVNVHMFTNPKPIDAFALIDETGKAIENKHLLDNWTMINFGYTSCPDICPTNLADASIAMRILNEDFKINTGIQSWFISVDPKRDTQEVIFNYTEAFHPDLLGLRAQQPVINVLTLGFGFSYQIQTPEDPEDEVYWIAHADMMILINPQGQYAGYILPPYDSQNIALALKNLLEG